MKLMFLAFIVFFSSTGHAQISAYTNYNSDSYYTDPYRNITRPGDNLEAVVINEISKARKSVFVAVQELRLPLIAMALIEKKRQGVDVRLIIENDYNFNVLSQPDIDADNEYEASRKNDLLAFVDVDRNGRIDRSELQTRDAIYMLQQAGIPIMDDTSDASRGSGLMHHKFVVVDGRHTVISSANFTMSCIHGDILNPSTRGNANSIVVVESPSLAKVFTEEFNQMWGNGKRGNFGHNKTYRGPQTVTVKGSKITVQFSPTSRSFNWGESVNGLIGQHLNRASKSVFGALFVYSDQMISDVLEKRHNKGVEIGLLIEPKFAYRYYSEVLDMLGLQMFNPKCVFEPNNRPWRNPNRRVGISNLARGDVLHHKFAVVDGKSVIIGSQNWSDSANHVNDETLVVIENKKISDFYTQEFERLEARATLGAAPSLIRAIDRQEDVCRDQAFYY